MSQRVVEAIQRGAGLLPLSQPPSSPASVLIIKPSSLGDVVSAVPVLRGLKRSFPSACVSWLLAPSCAPLVAHDADLDEVILFNRRSLGKAWRSRRSMGDLRALLRTLRKGRFDWTIDLQGLWRSELLTGWTRSGVRAGFHNVREGVRLFYTHCLPTGLTHAVDRNIELARGLGIDARPEDFRLEVSQAGRRFADETIERLGLAGGYLVCVPGTRWPTKVYPVSHWRQVVARLSSVCPVVLVGSPDETELVNSVADGAPGGVYNLVGRTDIEQLVGIIAASRGVLCSDSSAMYIAPATGVDVLAMIGPTRLELTGPYGRGGAVVSAACCQGCLKRSCRHSTCMGLIEPAVVAHEAQRMLESRSAGSQR